MNRSIYALSLAAVATALTFATAAPVFANEQACVAAPAALRAAAGGAEATAARNALRQVATAEKLCDAGNERAAARKFKVAAKLLKVDYAALTAPTAAAQ